MGDGGGGGWGWRDYRNGLVLSSVRPTVRPPHFLGFPRISGQTDRGIDFKLGGYIHYGTPLTWLFVGHAPLNFRRITADWIRLKFGGQTHYGPPQAWLTFGHVALNFRCFLATDFSNSFHTFGDDRWSDWAQILVGKFIKVLPWPDLLNVGGAPLNSCSFLASDIEGILPKGPYAWQIEPFWQDTLDIWDILVSLLLPLSLTLVRDQSCLGREAIT